jgi:hypothetical protein
VGLIVVRHRHGHLAITQQSHAEMCEQLADAWGNDRFPRPDTAPDLVLAAGGHELGMLEWDREPALDPRSGLPASVKRMDLAEHLPLRRLSPDRLASRSEYASLLCSLHHTSFYSEPSMLRRLRRRHRLVHGYLTDERERQRALRARLKPGTAELDRDWRLVRCWDAISHVLLLDRSPERVANVPMDTDRRGEISIRRSGEAYSLDPWPFGAAEVSIGARGHLLDRSYDDRDEMLSDLAAAPEVELNYALRPA